MSGALGHFRTEDQLLLEQTAKKSLKSLSLKFPGSASYSSLFKETHPLQLL